MATSGRHLARRNAVQALYQWDMTGQAANSIRNTFIFDDRLKGRHLEYFLLLIKEIPSKSEVIDYAILKHTDRKIKEIDRIEKAILRVGTYEALFQIDVPHKVVVNEAIEIAKLFCADQAYKFVNAVMDKVVKAQSEPQGQDQPQTQVQAVKDKPNKAEPEKIKVEEIKAEKGKVEKTEPAKA